MKNKWIAFILVLSMLFLNGCNSAVPDILDAGADRFAEGKPEESYYLKNSGVLLDELIGMYSGSYQIPSGIQIDPDKEDPELPPEDEEDPELPPEDEEDPELPPEDEEDPELPPEDEEDPELPPKDSSDPNDTTSEEADNSDEIPTVGSWDDFLNVFLGAYRFTSEQLAFELVDGYMLDWSEDLGKMHIELQRKDPIHASCVKQWTYSWVDNTYNFYIDYSIDVPTLKTIKAETSALVDAAVSAIHTEGMSDYEIICAVNEYLCANVYYPDAEPYAPVTHTAYGALHDGVAVCEGYSCAAKLMLDKLGIRCDIQVGTCIDGGGHAWNLVELDGEWYQMDVTWNDGSTNVTDYLLVDDDYMQKSRSWEASNYPTCSIMYSH